MTTKKNTYKVEKRTAIIDFAEDSPWHGGETTVAISVPFKTLFWFQKAVQDTESSETNQEALRKFGDEFLISWNVTDSDGNEYPATGEGLIAVEDSTLVTALMEAWVQAVVSPSENLSSKSASSGMSEKQSMEQLASISEPQLN